jgi:hypothetical protein
MQSMVLSLLRRRTKSSGRQTGWGSVMLAVLLCNWKESYSCRELEMSCSVWRSLCSSLCQDDEDVGEADFQERLKAELDKGMKE